MEREIRTDVLRLGVIKRAIVLLLLLPIASPSFAQAIDGQWIEASEQTPSQVFHKTFSVMKGVKQATVRISSLGLYELRINDKKVGDRYFTPGWTAYNSRIKNENTGKYEKK